MATKYAAIDFETHETLPRPDWPPRPVGLAVHSGGRSRYYAFGHPTRNNAAEDTARRVLRDLYRTHEVVAFNAAFDLSVAAEWWGLRPPPWHRIHDVQLLTWLHAPNQPPSRVDLKSYAEDLLGLPHDERNELRDWIFENIPGAKRAPTKWGRFIAQAPGDLVGRYAKGDLRDTWQLFKLLHVQERGEAYDRERKLLVPLAEMGSRGVPVNVRKLEAMEKEGDAKIANLERRIRRKLGPVEKFTGDKLADAIDEKFHAEWIRTPTGLRSTSIDNLRLAIDDDHLIDLLEARALIAKQLSTFVRPWLAMSRDTGRIYCNWNQCPVEGFGARTGRLSSSPNFQNVPRRPRKLIVPQLHLREAVEAPRGYRLIVRDYSQQELRLLAHSAGGVLLAEYQANPDLDMHAFASDLIHEEIAMRVTRDRAKTIGFGVIYGMGGGELARRLDTDTQLARLLKDTYLDRLEIRELDNALKSEHACTTWGGRYCPEEPALEYANGYQQTWEYKLLNTLIQGSAADQTKEAMIRFEEKHPGKLAISVHDELLAFAPTSEAGTVSEDLGKAMSEIEGFALAFPTTGGIFRRWSQAK